MESAVTCRFTPVTLLAFALIYFIGPKSSSSVYIVCGCALVVGSIMYTVYANKGSASSVKQAVPTVLILSSMIYVAGNNKSPWFTAYDDNAFVLIVTGAAGYVWVESARSKANEIAYVVRDMVYVLVAALATSVLAFHLRQLTRIFEDPVSQQSFQNSTSFLKWTTAHSTLHNCTDESAGIIFGDTLQYSQCPRQLWEQIRLDVILTTQVYATYTLTTRMRHDQVYGHKSLLIALAVVECISFCAAAVLQFDDIDSAYTPQQSAMTFVFIGGLAWALDFIVVLRSETTVVNPDEADVRLTQYDKFVWRGAPASHRRPKLKL